MNELITEENYNLKLELRLSDKNDLRRDGQFQENVLSDMLLSAKPF